MELSGLGALDSGFFCDDLSVRFPPLLGSAWSLTCWKAVWSRACRALPPSTQRPGTWAVMGGSAGTPSPTGRVHVTQLMLAAVPGSGDVSCKQD